MDPTHMRLLELVLQFVGEIAWPLVALIALLVLNKELRGVLNPFQRAQPKEVEGLGLKVTYHVPESIENLGLPPPRNHPGDEDVEG